MKQFREYKQCNQCTSSYSEVHPPSLMVFLCLSMVCLLLIFFNSALPLWHFFRVCLHLKNNNTLGRANSYKKDYNLHFSFFSQEIKMRLYIWSWNILPLIFFMDNNFKRVGVVLVASYFTTTTPWRICPTCFWPLIQDVN